MVIRASARVSFLGSGDVVSPVCCVPIELPAQGA